MRRVLDAPHCLVFLLLFAFAIPWEYSLDLGEPLGNIARIARLAGAARSRSGRSAGQAAAHSGPMQWLVLALYLWFCCTCFWTIDPLATLWKNCAATFRR